MAKTEKVFNPKTGVWENCGVGLGCQKHVHDTKGELEKLNSYSTQVVASLEDKSPEELVDDMLSLIDSQQATLKKAQEDWEESHRRGTEALAKTHNFTVDEYEKWLDHSRIAPDKGLLLSSSNYNHIIDSARYATWEGHLVQVNAESDESGPYTELNYYIGETLFKTVPVHKHFTNDTTMLLEEAIEIHKPF